MRNYSIKMGILFMLTLLTSCNKPQPPVAIKIPETNKYHGQKITDDYRYFEDLENPNFLDWLKNQNEYAQGVIQKIPHRDKFLKKLIENKSAEEYKATCVNISYNDYYFYVKRKTKEDKQGVYFKKGYSADEELLFDTTNDVFKEKKGTFINYLNPNDDGSKLIVGYTYADKEFGEVIFYDLEQRVFLTEILENVRPAFSGIYWLPGDKGIIYLEFPVMDLNKKGFANNTISKAHFFGSDEKTLMSKVNNPELPLKEKSYPISFVGDRNNNWLVTLITSESKHRYSYYCSIDQLKEDRIQWEPLFKKEDEVYQFFFEGDSVYFSTSKAASNFKICKTNASTPNFENPEVLITEDAEAKITDFRVTSEGVYFVKVKNGVDAGLFFLDRKNSIVKKIQLPEQVGTITLSSNGIEQSTLWIETRGWLSPRTRYRLEKSGGIFIDDSLVPVAQYKQLEGAVVEEIEIPSHDGVIVPLSIIYKKGLKKDGNTPVLLNAYGAYGWSNSPMVYSYQRPWVDQGGIYAVAHVRGGGEKGDNWHKQGMKTTKANSWKDLIACTEYLISKGYSSPKKMSLWGASAGGITIGRAVTERPDLYAAAVIRVGVLNSLRKEFGPNGEKSIREYGTVEIKEEFKALLTMDAYHNVKDGVAYPALWLTAGMNDVRVPPSQPAKFAARLQEANGSDKPVLLSVDFEGGHGFYTAASKKDKQLTDIMTFLFWQTGHPDYQPQ